MKLLWCLLFSQILIFERCYSLICYTCNNCTDTNCPCNTTVTSNDGTTYCRIAREQFIDSNLIDFSFGSVPRNQSTVGYVKDPYFILIRESTIYKNDTQQWITYDEFIEYGCQWDRCNQPSLALKLLDSFSLKLDTTFLMSNIYGDDDNLIEDCNECSDDQVCGNSSFIDFQQCPPADCTGTSCVLTERYPIAGSFDEFCYQSLCISGVELPYPLKVEIDAILYLETQLYEIWEIDIYCRSSNCGDPGLFQRIRSDLEEDLAILEFLKNATTSTTSTTSPRTTAMTTNDSSINGLRSMLAILICVSSFFFF